MLSARSAPSAEFQCVSFALQLTMFAGIQILSFSSVLVEFPVWTLVTKKSIIGLFKFQVAYTSHYDCMTTSISIFPCLWVMWPALRHPWFPSLLHRTLHIPAPKTMLSIPLPLNRNCKKYTNVTWILKLKHITYPCPQNHAFNTIAIEKK